MSAIVSYLWSILGSARSVPALTDGLLFYSIVDEAAGLTFLIKDINGPDGS